MKPFGKEYTKIKISDLTEKDAGFAHGGGDAGIISELYDIISGAKTEYTSLEESVESHLMGIMAEQSRFEGGTLKNVH